ncbi:DUF2255 family protein [Microlunatus spumicola]|uniref:DUF2255 family protein n=1 Tax=Microlunatus spumicola TaxID=81499 RepID=A0ABP6WZA1_9ACTN
MSSSWRPDELDLVERAHELEIAVRRPDGTLRRWTPVWVVVMDGHVHVRSWYRRGTGWFGHAVTDRLARVRVPGLEADVDVVDVGGAGGGPATGDLPERVDAAYRAKYGRQGAASMVTPEAVATTLRLDPTR